MGAAEVEVDLADPHVDLDLREVEVAEIELAVSGPEIDVEVEGKGPAERQVPAVLGGAEVDAVTAPMADIEDALAADDPIKDLGPEALPVEFERGLEEVGLFSRVQPQLSRPHLEPDLRLRRPLRGHGAGLRRDVASVVIAGRAQTEKKKDRARYLDSFQGHDRTSSRKSALSGYTKTALARFRLRGS